MSRYADLLVDLTESAALGSDSITLITGRGFVVQLTVVGDVETLYQRIACAAALVIDI